MKVWIDGSFSIKAEISIESGLESEFAVPAAFEKAVKVSHDILLSQLILGK